MNIKNKKIITLVVLLAILLPMISMAAFNYIPMEEIPGFGRPTDFPGYVMAIYKMGLWAVGICALLMISIGGYMYLTSAGNTSQTGKAKEIIIDSIIGIVLALTSWLLLYTINPDLVVLSPAVPDGEDVTFNGNNLNNSDSSNIQLYKCVCVKGSWRPFYYPKLAESLKATDSECKQYCSSVTDAKYYSFANLAGVAVFEEIN